VICVQEDTSILFSTLFSILGWRGTLEAGNRKRWWVPQKDFGTGPFRWALYTSQDGPLLGTSGPFYLPTAAYEMVTVVISLDGQHGATADLAYYSQPPPVPTPQPPATSSASVLLPITGTAATNAWPSIIAVLGLVLGGGLLLNHANKRPPHP
jgi:hypothetical protein